MFTTKSLRSLKGILPSIHHQLPLSQRESQQLLNALTTSFRRHLDEEHGWQREDSHAAPSTPRKQGRPSPALTPPPKDVVSHQPVDRHLHAILANPLFAYGNAVGRSSRAGGIERDPLDVFDEAVARGLMTPRRAAGCLQAKRREIVDSPALSITSAMAASGAGRRAVQWLRASGLERDLSFVTHRGLAGILLKFMVAEGLDDIAWAWVERLIRGEGLAGGHQLAASSLVGELVRCKAESAPDLNDAYSSILRGDELLTSQPNVEPTFLRQPWHHLYWHSAVEAWKRSSPSVALYEAFVAVGDHLGEVLQVERAHLDLHHPTKPDSTRAVDLLRNERVWSEYLPTADADANNARGRLASRGLMLMSMGLDTVQHLTQTGHQDEAQTLLGVLRRKFGNGSDGEGAALAPS